MNGPRGRRHAAVAPFLLGMIGGGGFAAFASGGVAFAQVTAVVEADVYVNASKPDRAYGRSSALYVDASVAKRTFLRVAVSGADGRRVQAAVIRLTVSTSTGAGSNRGGRILAVTSCGWNERTLTWRTQPPIDGPVLAEVGAVAAGSVASFDVTPAIAGDGIYCFAVDSLSSDGVTYRSREASSGRPVVEVTLASVWCGDGAVNQGSEACDGGDAAACPGACRADCTCPPRPVCGDGVVNQAGEVCDGRDDAACPGACEPDCACPPPPTCGDGVVNQASERCDGPADAACPGACGVDCTCPPPPSCGDGVLNQESERCDGTADAACPGACRADCTCPGACGDAVVNQPTEHCDGPADAACPGACRADCTCPPGPFCGDDVVDQPTEQCDGSDDAACPGACRAHCVCTPPIPTGVVEADVSVRASDPTRNYGGSSQLHVDAESPKHTFLRVRVSGLAGRPVLRAVLRLRVTDTTGAPSDSGGRIHTTGCEWDELTMTWDTQPPIDGAVIEEVGAVGVGDVVAFDVTPVVAGDGTYCFALDSRSGDGVIYNSREASTGPPALEVSIAGVCGDEIVNQAAEECDGVDDAACPVGCLADCTCAPSPPSAFACLREAGPLVTLRGDFPEGYRDDALAPATRIDARTAAFLGWPAGDFPLNLGGGEGLCLAGGTALGRYDRSWTWTQMHDLNKVGVAVQNDAPTVDGVRIDNVTDGVRLRDPGMGFTIRNAWMTYVRDDCVENDYLRAGLVEDSLLDGCYVGFSARPSQTSIDAGLSGAANVWTIRSTLVRLEPMPGPRNGTGGFANGVFFKWHSYDDPATSLSPKLALYDNVFLAEQASEGGGDRMGPPPGQVIDCANNIMVWLGAGAFPGQLPACFTITRDRAVWDGAVAAWKQRHPEVGR